MLPCFAEAAPKTVYLCEGPVELHADTYTDGIFKVEDLSHLGLSEESFKLSTHFFLDHILAEKKNP